MSATSPASAAREVEVHSHDLPLHCPMPQTPVWGMHPRVFIDLNHGGKALCPYCGTQYRLVGKAPGRH
jgi:uncharacterized Zn-finger protein